ncbi:hypothetical protein BZM27_52905 [Paraburkholderia steynii]|uniref:Uncharacterized protein n=1 Tax=Paraburkholderia steynii TaxID=1245441 RepID=A0A4R0X858_9BURK|nr:hypothetical protein BZM27_52905 [Paraburkholderia steynii]
MARPPKKIDADALVGEIALMRSSIWQNGKRKVAAIITRHRQTAALLPERAIALVSVTAFAPGAPSRLVRDVPLYDGPQGDDVMPSAWLKR